MNAAESGGNRASIFGGRGGNWTDCGKPAALAESIDETTGQRGVGFLCLFARIDRFGVGFARGGGGTSKDEVHAARRESAVPCVESPRCSSVSTFGVATATNWPRGWRDD